MPGERLKRKRILGVSIEASPGVAETLDAADAAIIVYDAVIQPEIEYTARPKNGSMSQSPPIIGATKGKASFKTELIGGASTALVTLLQGCGLLNTAGVLTPQSMPPTADSSGTKTLTIAIWQDGKKKQIHGAQGNAVFRGMAGQIVLVEFEFSGVWDTPVDEALVSPTYPTATPLRLSGGTHQWSSWDIYSQKWDFDLGNEVVYRYDAGSVGGILMAAITDRNPKISVDAEASLLDDHDIFTASEVSSTGVYELSIGVSGNRFTLDAPAAMPKLPTEGERDKLETDEIEFILCADDDDGDDEFSLTFV